MVSEAVDSTEVLPDELLLEIFNYLPIDSLIICEEVSQRWRKLALDGFLWKKFIVVYSGKCGQSEVSEKNLQIIRTHGEVIYSLKLQYLYSYQLISSILKHCPNLHSLELVMCRVSQEFEDEVKRWPYLKKLVLKNSLLETNEADLVIYYDQFKSLKLLSLSDFGLSSINCDSLLRCNLTHIFIEKIKNLTIEFMIKLILSKQQILEVFHIYGGHALNNKCLQLLSLCPELTDLAIIRCEDLTDEGLIALSGLKKIEHLQIWNNSNFTELTLLQTLSSPSLVKLQSLSLSRISNVSPVIVDVISEYYKNLGFLALYQCQRIVNTDYEKQLKSKFRNIDVVLY